MDISQRTRQQHQQVSPRKTFLCSYLKYMTYYAAPPRGDDNKGKFELDACFCIIHVAHVCEAIAHTIAMLPLRFISHFLSLHLFSTYLRHATSSRSSFDVRSNRSGKTCKSFTTEKAWMGRPTPRMQNAHISHTRSNC